MATGPVIEKIAALDFVLFIELIEPDFPAHDQSTPLVDGDILRPGTPLGHTRYSGAPIPVGIMDSGFKFGPGGHQDLALKVGCALNFTTDSGTGFADGFGHGTHILGTIAGEGGAQHRFKGMAPGVGSGGGGGNIKGAKIYTNAGMGNSRLVARGHGLVRDGLRVQPGAADGDQLQRRRQRDRADRHGPQVQEAGREGLGQRPALRGRRRQRWPGPNAELR